MGSPKTTIDAMLADILGITIEVSCIEELSALGVLMLHPV
jgi:hypothetical protein